MFGDNIIGSGGDSAVRRIMLKKDGSETLVAVKGKAAVGAARLHLSGGATQLLSRGATAQAAFGGAVVPERLSLFFGPNARRMGSQYVGDPAGEDSTLCLTDFSVLAWLARFPQWRLGVRMLPEAPPPPGVAEHRAAALAEKKDPDKAVQEARAKVCSQLRRARVHPVAVHSCEQAQAARSCISLRLLPAIADLQEQCHSCAAARAAHRPCCCYAGRNTNNHGAASALGTQALCQGPQQRLCASQVPTRELAHAGCRDTRRVSRRVKQ